MPPLQLDSFLQYGLLAQALLPVPSMNLGIVSIDGGDEIAGEVLSVCIKNREKDGGIEAKLGFGGGAEASYRLGGSAASSGASSSQRWILCLEELHRAAWKLGEDDDRRGIWAGLVLGCWAGLMDFGQVGCGQVSALPFFCFFSFLFIFLFSIFISNSNLLICFAGFELVT
jgi:hypothetical protein